MGRAPCIAADILILAVRPRQCEMGQQRHQCKALNTAAASLPISGLRSHHQDNQCKYRQCRRQEEKLVEAAVLAVPHFPSHQEEVAVAAVAGTVAEEGGDGELGVVGALAATNKGTTRETVLTDYCSKANSWKMP